MRAFTSEWVKLSRRSTLVGFGGTMIAELRRVANEIVCQRSPKSGRLSVAGI
jgi:hypothetical protein